MTAIFSYLAYMLPFALLPLPFAAVFRWLRVRQMRRLGEDTQLFHEIGLLLFIAFLGGLLSVTVLPKVLLKKGQWMLYWGYGGGIRLIPFHIFQDCIRSLQGGNYTYLLINLLGNILMFLPVGLLPSLLWRNPSLKKAVLLGFGLSLFIELSQLFLPSRWTDVDDLWTNTLGAVCGYGLFRLIPKKIQKKFLTKEPGS